MSRNSPSKTGVSARLDRWLWVARFYKTRSLAADAVDGGKVQVNGTRVKRSKLIVVGDELRIRKPPFEHRVIVLALAQRRGSAAEAHRLYEETPESLRNREELRDRLKYQPRVAYTGKGRPTKKERRTIDRLKRGGKRGPR